MLDYISIQLFSALYKLGMVSSKMTADRAKAAVLRRNMAAAAVLENYYMMNGCFLKEGQLLRHADRIAHLPVCIVNGRADVVTPPAGAYLLAGKLDNVRLRIVPGAGHNDRVLFEEAVKGAAWVADQIAGRR